MNEIKIFKSPLFGQVRTTISESGEPLLCAADVCKALGFTNSRKAVVDHVGEEDVTKRYTLTKGGKQEMTFITESGLYSLIFGSKLPQAKDFKRWVTSEVLPSIRKTGGYIASNATDTPEMIMARALKVADETIKRNEQRMRELEAQTEQQATTIGLQQERLTAAAPKVDYYDKTLASKDCMTTTQIANDIGLSAKTLNKKLHEAGIIYNQSGQWIVNAKYKGWNLYASRTYTYQREDGETGTKVTTVWNQRGRRFILPLHRNGYNVADALKEIKGNKK